VTLAPAVTAARHAVPSPASSAPDLSAAADLAVALLGDLETDRPCVAG
jgi:hypothetical protein